jgi:hypothetical protein
MKLNNIYDVMSYLSDEDNYKKSIGFVLNKLYEETIEAQNNNRFLPMFLQDKKYFSINVDINKFTYYLYKSFIENKLPKQLYVFLMLSFLSLFLALCLQ